MRALPALAAAGALIAVAAGCQSSRNTAPHQRLIGFNLAVSDDTAWTEVLTLDRNTLKARGRSLRLDDVITADNDAAATSPVGELSPDRRTLAVGGSSGRIFLFDPARLRRVGSISLPRGTDMVDVDSWPRPDRLLAVYGRYSVTSTSGDSLAVVDPVARRIVRREALHGAVEHAEKLRDGTLVLSVLPLTARGTRRVVVVSRDGLVRSVRVGGNLPSIATDGHHRAFVVEDGQPIREIDVRSLRVEEHRVPLTTSRAGLPQPPVNPPGQVEPRLTRYRGATWLGDGLLGIAGGVDRPARLGGQLGVRHVHYRYQLVDTRTWRTLATMPLTSCRRAFGLYLCSASVGGFPPDTKGSRGSTTVVYDRDWKLLYRKRSTTLWRAEVAGHLLAGSPDGSAMSELDPRTGSVLRRLGTMRVWPADVLDWSAR